MLFQRFQKKVRANVEVQKKKADKWFDGIQVLRGIFCILVMISHSGMFFSVDPMWGACAVSGFFVISGFCSGYFYKMSSDGILIEMIKRLSSSIKKFYPLYFIVLVTSIYWKYFPGDIFDFLRATFLVQSYFGEATKALVFNHPTWFLSTLLLLLFLSPLLNRLICSKRIIVNVLLLSLFFLLYVFCKG